MTVTTRNPSGVLTNVASNLTVNLSGPGTTTFYSDDTCTVPITTVTVNSGSSSATFYFVDTGTGTISITSSATTYTSAIQNQTINTNPYVWTGAGGDANWNTAGNWSGGAAPGAGNRALFNNTCVSNCSPTINANISIGGIRTASDYSGTITQAATRTITMSSSGWVQMGGTFTGSSANITVNGPMVIAGGTYTSTSGTLTVNSRFTLSGTGVYNHNNGQFTGTMSYGYFNLTASTTFYNVTFTGYGFSVNITGTINIDGNLICNDSHGAGGNLSGGTINLKGNVSLTGGDWNGGGNATLRMVGSGTQTISMAATHNYLPSLEIASTGTVVFSGQVNVRYNYTYTSGTVTTTGSTFRLGCSHATCTADPGNVTYNNLEVYTDAGTINLAVGSTFKVAGNLTTNDYYGFLYGRLNTGTIEVGGSYSSNGNFAGGSALIRMNGTGTISTLGGTPNVEINTAGTITFDTTTTFRNDFTYIAGTVVATGSTVHFASISSNPTITAGSIVFNDVVFRGDGTQPNIVGTLNVGGNLIVNQSSFSQLQGGTIAVQGDLTMTQNNGGGSVAFSFTGSGTQTIVRTSGTWPSGTWTINKPSGTLYLGSAAFLGAAQAVNLVSGTMDMAGASFSMKTLTLNGNTLTKAGGTLTVNGAVQGTGSLFGGTVNP